MRPCIYRSVCIVFTCLLAPGVVGTALALDKCEAKVDPATATVQVSARMVSGTLTWGRKAGSETLGFTDNTCVSKGKANDCTLSVSGTTALSHMDQCLIYLADSGDNCTVYIEGCSATGGQLPLYFDDFEGDDNAWSPASTSQVPGSTVLGGYCAASGPFTRSYDLPAPHTSLRVRATTHFLDDWRRETAYLKVDGVLVWTRSHETRFPDLTVTGNPIFADQLAQLVDLVVPHSTGSATIEFGSTLATDSCDASLAIDDVMIATF